MKLIIMKIVWTLQDLNSSYIVIIYKYKSSNEAGRANYDIYDDFK